MKKTTDRLAKSIFEKENLEECAVPELQQLVRQYPYFGPLQVLLSEKLKSGEKSEYDAQVSKTLLYFNNPLWFHYLVNNSGEEAITSSMKNEIKEVSSIEVNTGNDLTSSEKSERISEKALPALSSDLAAPIREEFSFEPYHTVDYFASQGIKFREEETPADRFSQQLKSFTGWLKTMKRLEEPGTLNPSLAAIEKNVTHLADHSIEDRDVISEAMAEVWIKQGNIEKAMDIYHKLSLYYPSKSTYFARLIDQLKK